MSMRKIKKENMKEQFVTHDTSLLVEHIHRGNCLYNVVLTILVNFNIFNYTCIIEND